MARIPFYKPYLTGNELTYMQQALQNKKLAGNGPFTEACHRLLGEKLGHQRVLLTTSCTTALEMAAMLANTGPGDEVIVPAYTFPATANAFLRTGAKVVFADSLPDHPNVDPESVKALITNRTKVVVVMHYAGAGCQMEQLVDICKQHNVILIEDAAQTIDATYNQQPLGTFGHLAAISFHETKNVNCGEGGCLVVNDASLFPRAEIIWDGGTNRVAFKRGEVDHYAWQQIGSSFMMPETSAAFLQAQLEASDEITHRRVALWQRYYKELNVDTVKGHFLLPDATAGTDHNGHIFYLVCKDHVDRDDVIAQLADAGVSSVFHYLSLHNAPRQQWLGEDIQALTNAERFTNKLLRLPLFMDITNDEQTTVIQAVLNIVR